MSGRTVESIETAKANLKGVKTQEAVIGLPPGFIKGFRLRTENQQMIVGKGVMNCRGKSVNSRTERVILQQEYVSSRYVIRGLTYYVYMNASQDIKVDTIASVWDDNYFGYYHPTLYQYRFLGEFTITTAGLYIDILNQDPVVGNDINAGSVTSRLMQALMARVDNYIIVGQDPDYALVEGDVACFIYEDRIEIKKVIGGDWVIRQQFGDTTTIGHDLIVGAKMTVGAEMFIGFNSFSGTTTVDSPGEGDTVHYINGAVDQYQEYTNGGWVVSANGIKIGGLVAGLFLSMIACTGVYHPANPPASTEYLPNPYFRVFGFENDYEDQFGVDDWGTKSSVLFDATTYKYGDYSLAWDAAGTNCYCSLPASATLGSSQAFGAWYNFDTVDVLGYIMTLDWTAQDKIGLYVDANGDAVDIKYYVTKNTVSSGGTAATVTKNEWHYIGATYDSVNNKLYVIVDNTITEHTPSGSWGAGAACSFIIRVGYKSGSDWFKAYADELLQFYNKFLDPNYLVQHYTHNVAWGTDLSKADVPIIPDADGRVMHGRQAGDITQELTWHQVANPTTGNIASKTSGWTADRFSLATGGWEIDFSSVVPVGTKAVWVYANQTAAAGGNIFNRKKGDANISNTPVTDSEFATALFRPTGANFRADVVLLLNDDYVTEIAVEDTAVDLYISYPRMVLR